MSVMRQRGAAPSPSSDSNPVRPVGAQGVTDSVRLARVKAVGVDFLEDLGRLALFADLPGDELEAIARSCDEAAPSRRASGSSARAIPSRPSTSSSTARSSVVIDDEDRRVLSKGVFFGEVSVLLDEPASASIITRTPLRCLVVPGAEVEAFLLAHPRGDVPDPQGRGPPARDGLRVADVSEEPLRRRRSPATSRSPSTGSSATSTRRRSSGTDGTIDWYCCPHFDSPSVFGAILDRQRGGYYRIAPTTEDWTPKQLYFPDTNVLITRFLTRDGVGEVQDFMPIHDSPGSVFRHRLIRRVLGVRGELTFRVEVEPRFNYGRDPHTVVFHENGVVFRSAGHVAGARDGHAAAAQRTTA